MRAGVGLIDAAVDAGLAAFEQAVLVQRTEQHAVHGLHLLKAEAPADHAER